MLVLLVCAALASTDVSFLKQYPNFENNPPFILPVNFGEDLDKKTGYGSPSGQWFRSAKGGHIGYSMSGGVMRPGDPVYVLLNDNPANQKVRFRLSKLNKEYKTLSIIDEQSTSSDVSKQIRYSTKLPEEQDALYLLSIEVLSPNYGIEDNYEIEDTLLAPIHVPKQEIKSSITLNKHSYTNQDQLKLKITNQGPTVLLTGLPYKLQKYNTSTSKWENANIFRQFTLQGIRLEPGKSYEQKIKIDDLDKGRYRIIKNVTVLEISELKQTLIAEFEIE
ncbi:immunoglobulin-like domain-containing protein [Paenibacillus sp. RC67]|uniref:immunoglobulin-like domain-containing protein n=1 Tax=Paenibacillus sp. RC67 TaxID=3039392 RepID=UPI0032C216E8